MKKLSKLQINSGKLMKNEELITLRGGYGGCCVCALNGIHMAATTHDECDLFCKDFGGGLWSC
jgi:hypothetical protein